MDFREFSAKTVDDAITKACIEFGLSSDQLEIRTISEGSSGFLGIGSKPAVIQVRKKEIPEEKKAAASSARTEKKDSAVKKAAPEKKAEQPKSASEMKAEVQKETEESKKQEEHSSEAKENTPKEEKAKPYHDHQKIVTKRTDEEIVTMKSSAQKFLDGVFKAMDLPVNIKMAYDEEEGSLDIDFEGEDMGILIGKRGQTLDSLQYLVSLVVNRDQKNYVRVKLDTEDYRRRRKETLENLAKNIANKVRRTHHSVSLEAMNPYERRIIHSALQGNKYVETHSEGNEPYRHVVVTLKKQTY